ncbi:MAG: 4-hydroxy-tetrahydrodipicolinate synthase [Proteobacteria bacterium]|nr:4-hydroxy-tetrahydrodipicolinate synthase [Pseudomonadota bacterium]
MQDFSGVWVPLVTPFIHDSHSRRREIDFRALQALARRMADAGVAGLVACGSTGEAAALDDAEQLAVLDAVIEAVPSCPVVAGLSGSNMEAVQAQQRAIQQRAIAGLLVPPPSYIRPSQAGIVAYFHELADAATVPLILYTIPYRTGVEMQLDTIRALAEHPRISAIKDCGGDPDLTMQMIADGKLQVLAGEDRHMFSTLCMGGAGIIAASAHIRPDLFVQLYQLIRAEKLDTARRLFHRLLPLIGLLFEEANPAPVKALLASQGLLRNELRPPLQTASNGLLERLLAAQRELEKA